jgi:hypothetical protein
MSVTRKDRLVTRWGELKAERSSWMPHWQELSTYVQPRLGRFFISDRDRGQKRHNNIYDSTGTRALRVLAAGLMAGMTSPARPWFRLTTPDPHLSESHQARLWLDTVRRQMLDVFARSNTYRTLHGLYEELGLFGTGASILMPDFNKVVHHYPSPIGEFAIATDAQGRVNTFFREFQMRVGAVVTEYGIDNCTLATQRLFRQGTLDSWVTVCHIIEPRNERDYDLPDAKNMPWRVCYFEQGCDPGKYLREGGNKIFRPIVPRWAVTGSGDIYGNSPGMEALGDVKQLQHEQLRKSQGIDYQTKPPLQAPTNAKGQEHDTLPGGVTYYDAASPQGGIKPLFETRLDLSYLLQDIQDVRGRINSAFYADLFLMLAQAPMNGNMTATEVAERHEEKLLMLGPVLERLHDELLDPLIATTFADMLEAGMVPPPPAELNGQPIRVEFVSMLAQAQRAIGTASTDRFVSNLGTIASFKPEVLDKFDADAWADTYSDWLGVDPQLIVGSDQVAMVREQRAQQQKAAEAAAMANQAADTANKLGGAPTQGGDSNALNDIMGLFSGYNSPSAETY